MEHHLQLFYNFSLIPESMWPFRFASMVILLMVSFSYTKLLISSRLWVYPFFEKNETECPEYMDKKTDISTYFAMGKQGIN